jgi:hypothetical protein
MSEKRYKRREQLEGDISPNAYIDSLTREISSLRNQLTEQSSKPVDTSGMFTAEQVDEMINKAVTESVEEALNSSAGYIPPTNELEKLNNELRLKDEIIDALRGSNIEDNKSNTTVDEAIKELTNRLNALIALSHEGTDYYDPDRPQMVDVFIDPSNKEEKFESFISIKDIEGSKVSMDDKVSKLKSIFGNKIPQ